MIYFDLYLYSAYAAHHVYFNTDSHLRRSASPADLQSLKEQTTSRNPLAGRTPLPNFASWSSVARASMSTQMEIHCQQMNGL